MEFAFRPLSQVHALEIANDWKYDGIYSFYDMTADEEDYAEFVDENLRNKNDYFEALEHDELIGFFCVIQEGNSIEIGLGLRPDICGKGKGKEFVRQITDYIENNYKFDKLVMNVAAFNQRAIKVYRSCGFKEQETISRSSNGGIYEFLSMVKEV